MQGFVACYIKDAKEVSWYMREGKKCYVNYTLKNTIEAPLSWCSEPVSQRAELQRKPYIFEMLESGSLTSIWNLQNSESKALSVINAILCYINAIIIRNGKKCARQNFPSLRLDMLNDTWIENVYNLGSQLDHRLSDVLNSIFIHFWANNNLLTRNIRIT